MLKIYQQKKKKKLKKKDFLFFPKIPLIVIKFQKRKARRKWRRRSDKGE